MGAPPSGFDTDIQGFLSPTPFAQRSLKEAPTRNYQGLPLEGWMLYPSLFLGAVYDDNIFQSTTNRVGDVGLKLRPSIVADSDAGIHRTTAFANGDFNIYSDQPTANTAQAQAGFVHRWEAMRDLVFNIGGEYDRHTDIYNNGFVTGPSGGVVGTISSPERYNYFGGYVSGVKSFDKVFIGLKGSAYATTYDPLFTTTGSFDQGYRDNIVTTVTGRLGYALTPLLYGFVDSTGNFHNFSGDQAVGLLFANVPTSGTIYNSQGYRVTGGLGTDRIGLLRGEIYAGYQRQFYDYWAFGAPSSPVYGGKVYYYPTRAITVTASLDESYQDSGLTTVNNSTGSAAHVTQAATSLAYAMARDWTATFNGGYADVLYVTGGRHDHRWTAGALLNYDIFRNFAATFNYSLALVESNAPGGSFTRNQFSLGATYKY
ncbi:MAG TPA: outer membrane beta-barrel protein [Methylocystis sp.]|nr:outer membrane beta-barrel protein [Methylocystis sp.]